MFGNTSSKSDCSWVVRKQVWKAGGLWCLCIHQHRAAVQQNSLKGKKPGSWPDKLCFANHGLKLHFRISLPHCINTHLSSPTTYAGSLCKSYVTRHLQSRIYSLIGKYRTQLFKTILCFTMERIRLQINGLFSPDACTLVSVGVGLPTQHRFITESWRCRHRQRSSFFLWKM